MAVRILIRRRVPESKARKMLPLFKKMRQMATAQAGYISGETLRNCDDPEEFLVISTWQSIADWENWLKSPDRQKTHGKIDDLLGGETLYEAFYSGFTE
ncbi:MAG: antibiotic biosynthesis monooxygenase family protein [Desulfobacterales bacterium]|jgi:heme-degrading monooxygenase HmoA|nr:antibiotic biosynthesis monooxygenase family protein [Desulfobacterales bacterium]